MSSLSEKLFKDLFVYINNFLSFPDHYLFKTTCKSIYEALELEKSHVPKIRINYAPNEFSKPLGYVTLYGYKDTERFVYPFPAIDLSKFTDVDEIEINLRKQMPVMKKIEQIKDLNCREISIDSNDFQHHEHELKLSPFIDYFQNASKLVVKSLIFGTTSISDTFPNCQELIIESCTAVNVNEANNLVNLEVLPMDHGNYTFPDKLPNLETLKLGWGLFPHNHWAFFGNNRLFDGIIDCPELTFIHIDSTTFCGWPIAVDYLTRYPFTNVNKMKIGRFEDDTQFEDVEPLKHMNEIMEGLPTKSKTFELILSGSHVSLKWTSIANLKHLIETMNGRFQSFRLTMQVGDVWTLNEYAAWQKSTKKMGLQIAMSGQEENWIYAHISKN